MVVVVKSDAVSVIAATPVIKEVVESAPTFVVTALALLVRRLDLAIVVVLIGVLDEDRDGSAVCERVVSMMPVDAEDAGPNGGD